MEKSLRAYLDAYHEKAPEKLTEALDNLPPGFHPKAERIIKDWRDEHGKVASATVWIVVTIIGVVVVMIVRWSIMPGFKS